MLRNERFHWLSKSLTDGFFADNAVLALSKLKLKMPLDDKDEDAVLGCADFFSKRHDQERYYHCMMLVNRKKLPDVVLENLIRFFTLVGREKLHETDVILGTLA